MPKIVLASALARWLPPAAAGESGFQVDGDTLREALDAAFERCPPLRGYVLDEHGAVRHHVAIFIDGQALRDKHDLHATRVAAETEIYLLQALSGG
jgi:sulfur-carrier protein